MSEKNISLSDGFEDLLGTLRGLSGEYPSDSEIRSVTGKVDGPAESLYQQLLFGGVEISKSVSRLDTQFRELESNISQAIADHRETDAAIAEDLKRILAELEDVRNDVSGDGGKTQQPDESSEMGNKKSRKF